MHLYMFAIYTYIRVCGWGSRLSDDFMSALQDFTPAVIASQNGLMNMNQHLTVTELCTFPVALSEHIQDQAGVGEFPFFHSGSVEF
jgi:hypothetical protein